MDWVPRKNGLANRAQACKRLPKNISRGWPRLSRLMTTRAPSEKVISVRFPEAWYCESTARPLTTSRTTRPSESRSISTTLASFSRWVNYVRSAQNCQMATTSTISEPPTLPNT